MRKAREKHTLRGRVRIIGGSWRGRVLHFPEAAGLRPTPDRVRETLFNWLQPWIEGSRCLDLFAGSGALGFEALSRGASAVTLVERTGSAAHALRENADRLGARAAEILEADALDWVPRAAGRRYDIVFLDPPFATGLLEAAAKAIEDAGLLETTAFVYAESAASGAVPALPIDWTLHREKQAGQVTYRLYRVGVA